MTRLKADYKPSKRKQQLVKRLHAKGFSDPEIDAELALMGVCMVQGEVGIVRRSLGLKARIKRGYERNVRKQLPVKKLEATHKPLVLHENKAGVCTVTVVDKNALEDELRAKYGNLISPIKCAIGECKQSGLLKIGRLSYGYNACGRG